MFPSLPDGVACSQYEADWQENNRFRFNTVSCQLLNKLTQLLMCDSCTILSGAKFICSKINYQYSWINPPKVAIIQTPIRFDPGKG